MTAGAERPTSQGVGRYRLLRSDSEAVKANGTASGDRNARDALRLGVSFDDWPGLDHAEMQAANAAHHAGVSFGDLSSAGKATLVAAWIDGYRTGYGEAWDLDGPQEKA